jgi:hypothetical protein
MTKAMASMVLGLTLSILLTQDVFSAIRDAEVVYARAGEHCRESEHADAGIELYLTSLTYARYKGDTKKIETRLGVGRTPIAAAKVAAAQCNEYSICKHPWPIMSDTRTICTKCARVHLNTLGYRHGHKGKFCRAFGFDDSSRGQWCYIGVDAACDTVP